MEYLPWLLLLFALLALAVLSVRVFLTDKAADEITDEIAQRLNSDTNTRIDISSRNRHMLRLATCLNEQLSVTREQRLRYQQGDAELSQAITNISHDLRTPLTALLGYTELLRAESLNENATRCLDLIENRAEALKKLTEELFRYSVIVSTESGERETVNLGAALEESLVSFYGALNSRGIQPTICISENRVERSVDRSALSRVFDNIISNVLKYSDGDFSVAMDEAGVITFTNSASALDTVSVGKLFDRFYTVESGRSSTGLGLSIARLLVERMGGTVCADYTDGRLSITVSL